MAKILIIDDERAIRRALKEILEFENFQVDEAENGVEGVEKAKNTLYDIIFCDIKMPQMDGMEVLQALNEAKIEAPVIMISGHASIENAVDAIKKGAFDFIEKPLDLNRILVTVRNAKERVVLVEETKQLKTVVKKFKGSSIIGETDGIIKIKEMIEKVAPSDARVLITGGNGTGKELVARSLHDFSNRKKMPFIEVNCAAIPGELIESELFGHEKGSFTGAFSTRIGKFEEAGKGTLFLDEIAELNPVFQAKMLRVLQERQFSRVGGNELIPFEARIIVATHKNLLDEVKQDRFREDLYYRLYGLQINLPPLRERGKDILLLADFFIKQFCASNSMPSKTISNDAQIKLLGYAWPGNVRELKSVVDLAVVLSNTDQITGEDIQLTNRTVIDIDASQLTLREYNIRLVKAYLEKYNNNTKTVADLLDIGQTTIYRMLKED